MPKGYVQLIWSILEKDDYIVIELFYLGSKADVDVTGTIEGRHPIKRVLYGRAHIPPVVMVGLALYLIGLLAVTMSDSHSWRITYVTLMLIGGAMFTLGLIIAMTISLPFSL
jgi:hypothetical protein